MEDRRKERKERKEEGKKWTEIVEKGMRVKEKVKRRGWI
jgi:hypothetical protein